MLLRMLGPNRVKAGRAIVCVGMAFLAVAIFSHQFLHPSTSFSQDRIDAIQGFLFGIAVGITLCGVILIARQRGLTC